MSESEGGVALPGFDADTAVEPLGEGRFAATVSERWWVYGGPNGGYLAAVILRAILATAGGGQAPRSLTVHFQQVPREGPVELSVQLERAGSRVTFLSARMEQEGRLHATAMAVLSEDWSEDGYSELQMPEVGKPGELWSAGGVLLAQSRQLALLFEPAGSGPEPYSLAVE